MAVTIPSDIVLDVLRGANAGDVRASTARLTGQRPANSRDELQFSAIMDRPAPEASPPIASAVAPEVDEPESAYKGFERMFLRNMFELMLPAAETGVFGDEPAGGIWRSMAADQFAGVSVKSGGLGISSVIHPRDPVEQLQRRSGWPYFEAASIEGFAG